MDRRHWISVYLMLWLVTCVGSSPFSSIIHTSSKVGLPAVLPCTVTSHLLAHTPHIQWQTISNSVFERMGEELFQGEAYQNRVDVPETMLERGNCSLFLQDVRFSDAGVYESYLVVGKSKKKSRIFIQSVQLVVIDHKTIKTVTIGGDLILDLFTQQAEQVIFQNSNDTRWTVLWERGGETLRKGHLNEREHSLILHSVTPSDAGIYKVLDSQGLALSTVKVWVTEPELSKESHVLKSQSASGVATMSRTSHKLILLFLLFYLMLNIN